MKKYLFSVMALALAFSFTACEDDNDDNPTLVKATEFVLNTPAFQNLEVDLATSSNLDFYCSQPNYGFPLQCKYSLQYSLDGNFTVSVDEADADESLTPNYQISDESSSVKLSIKAATMAKGLQQIAKWPEGLVPATQKVYVRAKAEPKAETAANVADYIIYSNVVEITVNPYYIELADAPVKMWYLVGNLFGGKWGSAIGETALPMFIIPDYQYDKKSGTGEIEYVNYFITGDYDNTAGNESSTAGFKIQPDDFNWDLGMTGDNGQKGVIIYRNKGDDGGHIVAPADGYYRLVMNTEKLTASFEQLSATPAAFASVCLSGSFNDWSDTAMSPYNKEGIENHVWYLSVNFDADQEVKFKQADSWDSNWGSAAFPIGVGVSNGDNIKVPAGKWLIIFCDINGTYNFIAQ